MIEVDTYNGVTILTPDVVRMNAVRAATIRDFAKTEHALTCKAFVIEDASGELPSLELWGGDEAQREELIASLKQKLNS